MISYKYSSDTIKGYKKSKIAGSETNDCVVRALANAFGMTYDQSHKFCESELNRPHRKGVRTFSYHKWLDEVKTFKGKKVEEITYEPVKVPCKISLRRKSYWNDESESFTSTKTLRLYTKKGSKYSAMTVGAFIKEYPKGTYILSVRRHTFIVKDSQVIGNAADFKRMKTRLEKVWKIS